MSFHEKCIILCQTGKKTACLAHLALKYVIFAPTKLQCLMTTVDNYDYCCSKDGHGLKYPGFSVVLLQVFALDSIKDFRESPEALKNGFLRPMENGIDSLIFNISKTDTDNIRRYELKGFDFNMPLETPYPVTLSGHVKVKMSVLFGHTVSISYRFVFDGSEQLCRMSEAVSTDHIIALLATHLSAEHWSRNKGKSETDINMEISGFVVSGLYLDEAGSLLAEASEPVVLDGVGRVFDKISIRYKHFVRKQCSVYKKEVSKENRRLYYKNITSRKDDSMDDFHYAMVDIWEDIMHPVFGKDGSESDLFSNTRVPRLSEADIVGHIRDFHKPELIGLMTMYPGEWPYRDPAAYDEVCGENIAIDTDDLVLVNNNVCVVIGTYGRRGADSPVDWEEHLQERSKYDVSWPEYLLILEMVVAKKFVISCAKDELIDATLGVEKVSSSDLIAHNAALSVRLSRLELQLDVVKYSRFMSHKVMFDRTTRRLDLGRDTETLNNLMEVVDNSLHNLSDYKAMKSDFILNFILALISVASTFELFFQQSEMPFLTFFGLENSRFAAVFLCVVATVTFFGILLVVVNMLKSLYRKVRALI